MPGGPGAGSAAARPAPWAKDQGIAVSTRGRIPADIVRQYEAEAKGR
jgi:hypothetical protein